MATPATGPTTVMAKVMATLITPAATLAIPTGARMEPVQTVVVQTEAVRTEADRTEADQIPAEGVAVVAIVGEGAAAEEEIDRRAIHVATERSAMLRESLRLAARGTSTAIPMAPAPGSLIRSTTAASTPTRSTTPAKPPALPTFPPRSRWRSWASAACSRPVVVAEPHESQVLTSRAVRSSCRAASFFELNVR